MEGIARAGGKRLPAGHQHSLGDSDLLIILWHYHLSVPIFSRKCETKTEKQKKEETRRTGDDEVWTREFRREGWIGRTCA